MAANTKQIGTRRDLTRRVARVGGLSLAKRLLKTIPFVGTGVALGFAGHEIKKKGWRNGIVHVGLDVIPFVGTAKSVVELFTGDLIPDKDRKGG